MPGSTKGKQFKSGRFHGADEHTKIASDAFTKSGNNSTSLFKMEPSLFDAAVMPKGKGPGAREPYVDVDRLNAKFPNGDMRPKNCAKLGFMSTNFRAVDKFGSTMNTERLRETLHKESRLAKKVQEENDLRMGGTETGVIVGRPMGLAPQTLYDVVHRQQPTSFKHARDDSQMRYVYMNQRRKEQGQVPVDCNLAVSKQSTLTYKRVKHTSYVCVRHGVCECVRMCVARIYTTALLSASTTRLETPAVGPHYIHNRITIVTHARLTLQLCCRGPIRFLKSCMDRLLRPWQDQQKSCSHK